MSAKRDAHAYANLFPMMSTEELDALVQDIKDNGLRHPITLYKKQVLDGRNRLLACEKAGVEPTFSEYEGDDAGALALVISLNVQRRDLTVGQRAIVAARALPALEEEARKRVEAAGEAGKEGGRGKKKNPPAQSVPEGNGRRSRDDAAKVFKVGVNAVQQAKAVLADAPDLAEQVESCTLSLAAAYEQVQQRRKDAEQKAKDAERAAQFREAVSNGEMTIDQALQTVMDEERKAQEEARLDAEARQLWYEGLERLVAWVEEWVAKNDDDHLAWYSEPAAPGTETSLTAERLSSAISQLARVKTLTFERGDHVQA